MQTGTGGTGCVYCYKNQPTLALTLEIIPILWRLCPQLRHSLAYIVREQVYALSHILKGIHCHICLSQEEALAAGLCYYLYNMFYTC